MFCKCFLCYFVYVTTSETFAKRFLSWLRVQNETQHKTLFANEHMLKAGSGYT